MTKHVIEDRVKEGTTTVGTGSLVLTGAAQGCRSFASVMATGDTCGYAVDDGTNWEVGVGTLLASGALERTTVLTSSNANQIVAFPAGSKQVFITVPASRMVDGASLAAVSKSGSYADLSNKPTLFSGSYVDLTNKPTLFDGTYASLTGKPSFATVSTTGSYTDLLNKPSIPTQYTDTNARAAISATGSLAYNSTTGVFSYMAPTLATVATSGSYTDLLNKPSIPTQYTDTNARAAISVTGSLSYNSTTGVISYTAPTLATVATSGSYTDLLNKPTIPAAYTLPTASSTVLGGIKIGSGLAIDGTGIVSVTSGGTGTVTSVAVAAGSTKLAVTGSPVTGAGTINIDVTEANLSHANIGGVVPMTKGGTGLSTLGTANQVLAMNAGATAAVWTTPATYTLPTATASVLGGVKVGTGLSISAGVLSSTATGTVTSVGLTAGSTKVTVTGGPVTASGSITVDVAEANLSHANIGGAVPIAKGGTGLTALGTAKQVHRTNAAATATEWATLTASDVSGFATVATSGSYTDLTNKPTIPAAYADANARAAISVSGSLAYNSTTGVISYTAPVLATVATSGSYADLINKPTIPTTTSQITNNSDYTTKAYVDGQVGNISAALAAILG